MKKLKPLSVETKLKISLAKRGTPPHNKGKKYPMTHGTASGYKYHGCRCILCKKAVSELAKQYL